MTFSSGGSWSHLRLWARPLLVHSGLADCSAAVEDVTYIRTDARLPVEFCSQNTHWIHFVFIISSVEPYSFKWNPKPLKGDVGLNSGSCPFLESQMAEQSRLNVSNVSMQTYAARVKTFISWPSRIPVRPDQLANAGFYYVGSNDDVKCFCCDGGLRCWESGDDPWIEHAKWFPRCEYLLLIKKEEFVDQIQARFPHLLEQLYSTSETPVNETERPIFHLDPGENNTEDGIMMNTPVVQAALEMGFSRRLVRQTVQSKILATNENYKTVNELVSDLLNAEDEKVEEERERKAEEMIFDDLSLIRKNRMALFQRLTGVLPILKSLLSARVINEFEHDIIKQKTQTVLQARELVDMILVKGDAAATIFRNCLKECDPLLYRDLFVENTLKYTPSEDVSGLPMEEQLRRLQEERTCKVCMDKEVSIVFIPCGHLVERKGGFQCASSPSRLLFKDA
ncbi:hypothetical protein NDU88_001718 [Pleurodeles waltl]|uniref:RING-type E3 ubiquitin transferase n=1 Tax=Pleurodeles waltl TaxID=8319 RepID=A0AAV7NDD9_PLEWA|nr:hypothetical protein NDU88_001718 [Pleurodeles waltl]